jgi:hypothetical protein
MRCERGMVAELARATVRQLPSMSGARCHKPHDEHQHHQDRREHGHEDATLVRQRIKTPGPLQHGLDHFQTALPQTLTHRIRGMGFEIVHVARQLARWHGQQGLAGLMCRRPLPQGVFVIKPAPEEGSGVAQLLLGVREHRPHSDQVADHEQNHAQPVIPPYPERGAVFLKPVRHDQPPQPAQGADKNEDEHQRRRSRQGKIRQRGKKADHAVQPERITLQRGDAAHPDEQKQEMKQPIRQKLVR